MSRQRIIVTALIAIVLVGAAAWVATRQELASGSGKQGDWRIVASWKGNYCLTRFHETGKGGACGFAQPATLNESLSWKVFIGESPYTLVAGPVPPGATEVELESEDGQRPDVELTKVWGMTFFMAQVQGVQQITDIRALDEDGEEVERYEHAPMPPPGP